MARWVCVGQFIFRIRTKSSLQNAVIILIQQESRRGVDGHPDEWIFWPRSYAERNRGWSFRFRWGVKENRPITDHSSYTTTLIIIHPKKNHRIAGFKVIVRRNFSRFHFCFRCGNYGNLFFVCVFFFVVAASIEADLHIYELYAYHFFIDLERFLLTFYSGKYRTKIWGVCKL